MVSSSHSLQNWALPADDEEHARLNVEHELLSLAMNGPCLKLEMIHEVLEQETRKPAILDVGSGAGMWVIEMSRRFPAATVVGVDLTPASFSQ